RGSNRGLVSGCEGLLPRYSENFCYNSSGEFGGSMQPASMASEFIEGDTRRRAGWEGARRASARLPGVSIIICTRDRSGSLARTLEAIASMDLAGVPAPVELIIVDNGSTDETRS